MIAPSRIQLNVRRKAGRFGGSLLPTAGLVVLLLAVVPARLMAGPVLKIESIATDRFPELEVRAALHYPYPEKMQERESHFSVRERTESDPPDLYTQAALQSIQELPAPDTRLYLVLVLDTTRSVPARSFRKSIEAAQGLVRSLKEGESAAIYRINARPLLASGFTTDKDALIQTLASFKRTGRITRLYDSLHSAVLTAHRTYQIVSSDNAAAANEGRASIRERTAIVLLTDGRDEGSFLTDNDCAELAALSNSYDIPIYTLLYGNSKNLASLTRLSARTGGVLIRGLSSERIQLIPDELRRPRARHYRLRYRSAVDPGGMWPVGRDVQVALGWNVTGSRDAAEGRYEIPFPRGLLLLAQRDNFLLYLVGAGLLAFLLVLLLLFLALRARSRRRKRRELSEQQTVVMDSDLYADETTGSAADEFAAAEATAEPTSLTDDSVPPVVEEDEDFFVDTEADAGNRSPGREAPSTMEFEKDSFLERSGFQDPAGDNLMAAGLMRERRRITQPVRESQAELYMRDYSYRMLQNALRQARRYSEASLLRESPRGRSEYDVFLDTTILGTGRWANIHLDDASASPIHAKIRQVDHKFVIYDMLSAAGVFLNGRKILRPMALADGDQIQLGRTKLTFRGTV